MKQATGSNPQQPANLVSIRLVPGGHSFSDTELSSEKFREAQEVRVEVLTPRTLLVPAEVFSPGKADEAARDRTGRELLAANGTPPAANECAVWSTETDGTAAVVAMDAEIVRSLRAMLGGRERFTTPLLHTPQITTANVWLYYAEGLLYIKVYDSGLQLAEVIAAPAEADILYFTELLAREFPLGRFELHITSAAPKSLCKLIGGRFKKVTSEILK